MRDQIVLSNIAGIPKRPINTLAYVPKTRQFVFSLRRDPNRVWLLSREGILAGSFPITPRYGALQCVSEGGQDRLHIWSPPILYKLDLAGNEITTTTISVEGLVSPGGYVAGSDGQFLLMDANNSEVVLRGP